MPGLKNRLTSRQGFNERGGHIRGQLCGFVGHRQPGGWGMGSQGRQRLGHGICVVLEGRLGAKLEPQ